MKLNPFNLVVNDVAKTSDTTELRDEKLAQAEIQPEVKTPKISLIEQATKYIKVKYCTEHQVIGIEIQPDTIRVAEAKEINGKWKIEKIISKNILNTFNFESLRKNPKLYSDALIEVFSKNKIQNKNVAFAVPASLAITKTISLPLMSKESLDKATKIPSFWQNLVQISENLTDYSIYYKITKEISAKKEMDVLFVAVKKSDLEIYKKIISDAGLNLVVVDVGCFPIINLSKLEGGDVSRAAILKIGKDENYLEIMEDGKPYIYDIFVPENEKSYLNEHLEHQTFQMRFVSQLKHILSKHEDKFKIKQLCISVISSEKNISKLIAGIEDKLDDIKIEQTSLFENLDINEKLLGDVAENKSAFAIVVGLATRKIEIFSDDNKKQISDAINLLPDASQIKAGLRLAFYVKVILGFVVALSCLIVTFYSIISASQYQSNYNEISKFNALTRQYKQKNDDFKKITTNSGILNRLIKFSSDVPANQLVLIKAYKEIGANIPDGIWVEKIDIDKNSLKIEGRSFEEKNIILFTKAFENSEAIESLAITSMSSTPMENGILIKDFVITATIKTNNLK